MTTEQIADRIRFAYYRIRDFTLKSKPPNTPERPNPELFQGGNSTASRRTGGRYRELGVSLILAGFLHFQEEVEYFGAKVLPLVRELEAARTPAGVGR